MAAVLEFKRQTNNCEWAKLNEASLRVKRTSLA
jgi:hypothetical protein